MEKKIRVLNELEACQDPRDQTQLDWLTENTNEGDIDKIILEEQSPDSNKQKVLSSIKNIELYHGKSKHIKAFREMKKHTSKLSKI